MSRIQQLSCVGSAAAIFPLAVLLAFPRVGFAQHAPTGGGSSAGGGGLSGGGRASGVSVKDDLKGFHEALALQATSEQVVQYNAMLKSTETAAAVLQKFLDQLAVSADATARPGSAPLDQALQNAREQSKKFLDGLSERQKMGLKEETKRLWKADLDLAQQSKTLDQQAGDTRAPGQQILSSAKNLEQALASFRTQQEHLGEEMSIIAAGGGSDSTFNLPSARALVKMQNQTVVVTTTGVVSRAGSDGGQNTFRFDLTEDLSDLQDNIAEMLRGQLNKSDRCGERIAIRNGILTPRGDVGVVSLQLHYERWTCFGGVTMNEIVEGDGAIELKLAAVVAADGALHLTAETGRVEAKELLGDLLRSGTLGDFLREDIAGLLQSAMQQGADLKTLLPPSAQGSAALRHAQFQGTGSGKLMLVLEGEIRVSNDKMTALTGELKARASQQLPR